VLRENVAVLNNEVQDSAAFNASESLVASQVRSLLCVPLVAFGRVRGVIYLDTSDPMVRLDEEDLQLFTAIGGIAAVALDNARHLEWLESENLRLQAEINIEHNMVGESARMREVFQFIDKVAPTDATVLLCGESGTGKELVARAVHVNSPRAGKPFVAINCAALTETLLESELLGHERGAFTGAVAQKRGKFEAADGGTVFLDEIAELAPSLQAKLLRVLQEREFDRVGGTRPVKVDIRVIAATNKNLQEAIRNGTFRQDLYYRLNVVSLTMPPLRDRREDIPLLASHFVDKFSNKSKKQVLGISAQASASLMNYDWPGNVRELENAIERAVVLGSDELIRPEDLPETVLEIEPSAGASITKYHEAILEAKKQLIIRAVEQAGGNYTEAAKLLGVHPNYLHRLIRNMNLKSTLKSSR
jgi:Nif-specific regulatory protein